MLCLVFAPNVVVHGCKPGGIRCALQRFKVEFRQIHPIPIEPLQQSLNAHRHSLKRLRILQVDQLAPVQLSVL